MTRCAGRLLAALLAIAGLSLAQDPPGAGRRPQPEPLYTMTLLNSWELGWAYWMGSLAGLDFDTSTNYVWAADRSEDILAYFSVSNPAMLIDLQYLPGSCADAREIAIYGSWADAYRFVNDGSSSDLFYYHDGAWQSYADKPTGNAGMGMDVDEAGSIWEATTLGEVFRYVPGGSEYQVFELNTLDDYPYGLTCFPLGGQTGLAAAYFTLGLVEFYAFTPPSSWVYLGDASVPGAYEGYLGIEYVADRGTFYMLVESSGDYYVLELEADLSGIHPGTWGGIKSEFGDGTPLSSRAVGEDRAR